MVMSLNRRVIALVPVSQLKAVSVRVDAILPLDGHLPSTLNPGDAIAFDDARGRSRHLIVRAT